MTKMEKKAGCLPLLLFFVLEMAALAIVTGLGYLLFAAIIVPLVPSAEADFGHVVSVCLGLIAACPVVFWIDRRCKAITGTSVLDNLPWLP